MKMMRFLVVLVAGCAASACGGSGGENDGAGGAVASGGNGGSGSGGATSNGSGGMIGSGGQASGGKIGSGSGGSGSGGSSSGGVIGTSSGGATGSGGHSSGGAIGSGGQSTGGADAMGGHAAGGRGGITAHGGATGSGGSAGTAGTAGTAGGAGASGTYNPCPTNGDPCRILPVGDSITFGINYEGSYRPELFHQAVMAGQKITYTGTLQNGPTTVDGMPFPRRYEATSGITIDGISMQLTKNNTLAMPADIVLVHIGTNDMYMSDPGGAPDRLGKLIDQLAAGLPKALICVAKIIPLQMSAANVTAYNNAIPGVVAQRVAQGKHVIVVDLNSGFPSGDMDAVHPYQNGYQWMGDKWYAAIGGLFPM